MTILFASFRLSGQDLKENLLLKDIFKPQSHNVNFRVNSSEKEGLRKLVSIAFVTYKRFFSSQDINTCVFKPSCSVYAYESIQKLGFVKGIMSATDRLMRCNRFSPEEYEKDKKSGLFLDSLNNNYTKSVSSFVK